MLKSKGRILNARIVGFSKTIDLAVLKVEATGLPTLPFAHYDRLHKGEVVLAFGSPEGLENSVTFGLVSSVLRQPDPDDPMVYIQTDAAINPGNSGGPLVDVDGNVVGIDTFIYTKSGGNEGIGFAIPSGIASYAYGQIRKYGRVRRRTIGADLQSLTPDLSGGLGIAETPGVVVADVDEDGPAAHAGLRPGDVIEAIDGFPVDNVALFTLSLYLRTQGDKVNLAVVRGGKRISMDVPVLEPQHDLSRLADLANPATDLIPKLGIIGVTITREVEELVGPLRSSFRRSGDRYGGKSVGVRFWVAGRRCDPLVQSRKHQKHGRSAQCVWKAETRRSCRVTSGTQWQADVYYLRDGIVRPALFLIEP